MAKTNLKTRLSDSTGNLSIAMREGKNGFNVSFTVKPTDGKSQTGGRSSHPKQEDAKAAYEKLVSDATAKGWSPRVSRVGSGLAEIPMAKKREGDKANGAAKAAPAAAPAVKK